MATMHTPEELQQMFAAFGLAQEQDRQRFQEMTQEFGEPAEHEESVFTQRLSASSPDVLAPRGENAELEPDSRSAEHGRQYP